MRGIWYLSATSCARKLFPVCFGSGLKEEGVESLLDILAAQAEEWDEEAPFAARVFKIARDAQGSRLTFLKLLGGELTVRGTLRYRDLSGAEREEKLTQLRLYSGAKYEAAERLAPAAGQIRPSRPRKASPSTSRMA